MSCANNRIENIILAMGQLGQPRVQGLLVSLLHTNLSLPNEKADQADTRIVICKRCERCTWLRLIDYAVHLNTHIDRVIQDGLLFSGFPVLPVQPYANGKELFCSISKSWLPSKSAVETEQCPLDKWPKNE